MSRQELKTVARAAAGLAAGLGAFASVAAAAETGDVMLRTALATSAAGQSGGGLLKAILSMPQLDQVAMFTMLAVALAATSAVMLAQPARRLARRKSARRDRLR